MFYALCFMRYVLCVMFHALRVIGTYITNVKLWWNLTGENYVSSWLAALRSKSHGGG